MIINVKNKAAYYHAPKCGSRTILGWICLLDNPNLAAEHPEYFKKSSKKGYDEIRKLLNLFPNTEHDWGLDKVPIVEADYRFCVLRDPVDRFISAFTNRVLFLEKVSLKSKEKIDIQLFIDNFDLIRSISGDISVHFRPQYYFYGDLNKFHRVYKMKEICNVKEDLEKMFDVKLPDLHLQQNENVERPILNSIQIDKIKSKYNIDYENYKEFFE